MKKKGWIILGSVIVFIIALHLALEPVALYYVNKALGDLKGYRGHVDDVDIHLYRGAYRIDSLEIVTVEGDNETPFVSIPGIDISVEWDALFKGAIVAEVVLESPDLNFVKSADTVQSGGDNDYAKVLGELVPITINRFQIINGSVHFIDKTQEVPLDVSVTNLQLLAHNLRNVNKNNDPLPASVGFSGATSGNGSLKGDMGMNVLKSTPDFDLAIEVKDVDLTYLKDFTEAYGNFTFKAGTMYVSSEVVMQNGKYEGYVKPVLNDIKIVDLKSEQTSFWRKMWEVVLGTTFELFENHPHDQFATRVPISGDATKSDVGILATIGNVLRNAFIDAFSKNIEQSVNLQDLQDGTSEEDKGFFDFLKSDDKDE